MNKGISLSCGDYIQFLNSGDVFIDSTVLSRVAGYCNLKRNELLYGSIIYKYRNGKEGIRKYGKSCGRAVYFLTGDCINHQAIFASKGCFENCVFDKDNYRICADREWMMRVKKKHVPFVCMNEIVVKYSLAAGSLSVENKALSLQEERRCIIENYLWGYPIYFLFDFCRHNKYLKKGLHTIYKKLYISVRDDSSSK